MRKMGQQWTVTGTAIVGTVVLAIAMYGSAAQARGIAQPRRRGGVDFDKQIKPILAANCLECHSQDKRKGGLSLADLRRRARRRHGRRGRPARARPASSLLHRRASRASRVGDQMPLDELPLERRRDRDAAAHGSIRARALTPSSPPAPPPWEAPLALDRAGGPGGRLAGVEPARRSAGRRVSREGASVPQPALVERRGVRAARLSRRLGPAAVAASSCRRSSPIRRPTSASGWSRRCSPTTRSTPSTGSRSGTTCCATRTALTLLLRAEAAARASRPGCCRR